MRFLGVFLALLVLLVSLVHPCKSSRVLHAEEKGMMKILKKGEVNFQLLPRGTVPSSGSSSSTYIPGTAGTTPCLVKETNFAGGAVPHPGSDPQLTFPFSVASNQT
ncbi:hypothetical protein NMG60_11032034 [Bertholletia excelsa]